MEPIVLAPGEGVRVPNPLGGDLLFKLEGFFRGFAALPAAAATPAAFRELAAQAGMVIVGPPLAQSHPLP